MTVGFFPTPYRDELLYSMLARYAESVSYPSQVAIQRVFFGVTGLRPVYDLPNRLNSLLDALPKGHHFTLEGLALEHTLLPLYMPFLPSNAADKALELMGSDGDNTLASVVGKIRSTVPSNQFLRYCPQCVREDRALHGETYWHRQHQVEGVSVCSTHQTWLEESSLDLHNLTEYESAESVVSKCEPRRGDENSSFFRTQCQLARDCAYLLTNTIPRNGIQGIANRYKRLLHEKGYASYTGTVVNLSHLISDFESYFTTPYLRSVGCAARDDTKFHWLIPMYRGANKASSPLQHLLFIHWLGYTPREFFSLPDDDENPFHNAPYPCLNKAADHYGMNTITQVTIRMGKMTGRYPYGVFECPLCGFTYCRKGPDKEFSDRFKQIPSMTVYGKQWETKLRELWLDERLSIKMLQSLLGVSEFALPRLAKKNDLPFPKPGSHGRQPRDGRNKAESTEAAHKFDQVKKENRLIFDEFLDNNPGATREQVRSAIPRTELWLRRHDNEWMQARLPPKKFSKKARRTVQSRSAEDWHQLDIALQKKVATTAEELRTDPSARKGVTKKAVAKRMNQVRLLEKHLDRLPMTAMRLAQETETPEQFALRKIREAEASFLPDRICPSRWHFIERARLNSNVAKRPSIAKAIDAALDHLWHNNH